MKRLFFVGVLGILALAAGCGGTQGGGCEAAGSVLLNGQPLANAQVQFIAKGDPTNPIHTAVTDSAGKFTLKGGPSSNNPLRPGSYVVTVSKLVVKADASQPGGGMGATANEVPPIYRAAATTPLHADLQPGKNDLQPVELKSQGTR